MQEVKALAYHRNGISGLGFHVAIVAFELSDLAKGEIRFGYNSWRGAHYHEAVDLAVSQPWAEDLDS